MDVLFVELVEFKLPAAVVARCRVAWSQEEALRKLLIEIGIELIDYHAFTSQPSMPPRGRDRLEPWDQVRVFSKAWLERMQRTA